MCFYGKSDKARPPVPMSNYIWDSFCLYFNRDELEIDFIKYLLFLKNSPKKKSDKICSFWGHWALKKDISFAKISVSTLRRLRSPFLGPHLPTFLRRRRSALTQALHMTSLVCIRKCMLLSSTCLSTFRAKIDNVGIP